jgi:hypothetical protein
MSIVLWLCMILCCKLTYRLNGLCDSQRSVILKWSMSWTLNEKWYDRKHHYVVFILVQMHCYDNWASAVFLGSMTSETGYLMTKLPYNTVPQYGP